MPCVAEEGRDSPEKGLSRSLEEQFACHSEARASEDSPHKHVAEKKGGPLSKCGSIRLIITFKEEKSKQSGKLEI